MAQVTCALTPGTTGGTPITGYVLQRRPAGGTWATIATLPAATATYTDATVSAGTQYGYRLAAVNAVGQGPFSAEQTVTTTAAATTALAWISGASLGTDTPPVAGFAAWRGQPTAIVGMYDDSYEASAALYEMTYNPPTYTGKYANWTGATDYAVGWGLPTGATWAQAATGQYDALWTQNLNKMKNEYYRITRGQLYLRFSHEMNGSWYPWSVNSSNVADFKTAWHRFRTLQLQILPQAKLVWCLNGDSGPSGMSGFDMWPGDDNQVDVCGVDFYNIYPQVKTQADWDAAYNTTGRGIGAHLAFAASKSKPFAVCEWGNNARTNPPYTAEPWGEAPFWFEKMYLFFKTNAGTTGGKVLYDCLFDAIGAEGGKWQLYPDDATQQPLGAARYRGLWNGTYTPGSTPAAPTVTSINTFDANQEGWVAESPGTTLAQQTTVMHDGAGSLALTRTTLVNATGQIIKAGDNTTHSTYTSANGSILKAWVLVPSGSPGSNWRARIEVQDSSYTWQPGSDTVLTPGTWAQISYTPSAALWSAHQAFGVNFTVDSPAAGTATVYVDSLIQTTA